MLKRFGLFARNARSARRHRRPRQVESLEQRFVLAAPVAVDDSFDLQEDSPLAVIPFDFNVDFNAPPGAIAVASGATWQYLDKIQNQNGLNQTYPTDGSSRVWNHRDFDVATSTASIGAWLSGPTPLAGGQINAFPQGTPSVLAGLGQPNTVTTYLFRHEIQADASQAAETDALASVLCDDGCIGYLNGVEVFRLNMNPNTWNPSGPLTTNTETGNSNGTEDAYTDFAIDLSSANWQQGKNVLAVEVHQADPGSSDVGFDFSMTLGDGGAQGFVYADDVLSTNRGDLASGTVEFDGGFTGGAATIRLNQAAGFGGGGDPNSSGGWTNSFNVLGGGTAQVSLRYRLQQGGGHDAGEFGEAVLTIDGVRYGSDVNNSLFHRENGNNNNLYDSGWQQATFDVPLSAGDHTITLAAFNRSSGGFFNQNEWSLVSFDDVSITFSGGGAEGVLDNDTDADGDPLTAVLVPGSGPQHGTLTLFPSGSFVYTPDENYFGPDSFQYVANDGTSDSAPATVSLFVNSVNDPPIATAKTYDLVEDNVLTVAAGEGLLVGATDIDTLPGDLTAVLVQEPANGTVSVNADGSFTYTPDPDFNGIDSFRYGVFDGDNVSNGATVSIQISPVNDAPRGSDDTYFVVENTTLVADRLTASNSEILLPRGSVWRYLDNGSDQGTAWREVAYDDSGWVQEDDPNNFGAEYGYGDEQEGRLEQTVVGFGPDPNQKYITTYFRTTFDVPNVNAVTALTVHLVRDDGAAVYLNGVELLRDNLPAGAAYNTVAGPGFVGGNDEFTFFTFNVPHDALVNGQNLLAVEVHQNAGDSSDLSFDLELEATVIDSATALLVNDFDPEGDPISAVLLSDVAHGVLALNSDGTFTYTPNTNFEGVDTFTYAATDGQAQSDPVTATITVTPGPNDIPVAAPDAYSVNEDQVLTVSSIAAGVLANDTDGDLEPLTASVFAQPANGVVEINEDGTFTYTPNADFFGVDTFRYRAWDGSDYSPPATVTITVNPMPDLPRAVNDQYFVTPGSPRSVSAPGVLVNDYDPDGTSVTASLVSQPPAGQGTVSLISLGAFTYTPPAGFRGVTSFTYRVSSGGEFSMPATVTLIVDAAPTAVGRSYQVNEDGSLVVDAASGVLVGAADAENDPLTALVATPPTHGVLSLAADGSFTYTPAANYAGPDSFTYHASDGDQNSAPATITIDVLPVNDAPVGMPDSYDVLFNETLAIDAGDGVLANDIDIDSGGLSAVLASGGAPQFGALSLAPDGSFTYTPNTDYIGPDSFTYVVSDGSLQSDPTTVMLNVTSAADLVVINEIMYHPGHNLPTPENTAQEYIELINLGIGTINLAGWQFDRGIDFTFPDVSIPGGGILVVAADVAAFSAKYPGVTNVVGGWTGQLSNSGERIRLVDADGDQIDEVEYADEGDWAVRRQQNDGGTQGWVWIATHDGDGPSLELINPMLSNKRGQNWAASTVPNGTPGVANSVASSDTAPVIWDVEHSPAVPTSTDTVTVTAKLADVVDATITGTVMYRVSTTNPGPFTAAPMFDDGLHGDGEAGDGVYGAMLPAQADLTVVEFYVHAANDSGFQRTWPGPTNDAGTQQGANLLYQVDEQAYGGDQPFYRLIMTAAENNTFRNINRQSDAQMNATFINVDGTGTDVVYNVGLRIRGSGSRTRAVPNLRMNVPSDRPWQGVTSINLNTQYTFTQLVGMSVFELSGLPFEEATAVQLRVNGENRATEARQAGSYVRLETTGSDWAENHYPKDSGGNFYRGTGGFGNPSSDLSYLGENQDLYAQVYNKQTNGAAYDYSDLVALTRALDPAQTPDAVFVETVKQVIDVDQWMRFFAVNTLLVNEENGLINGNNDDFSLYRGILDPRFDLVVHDMDSVFGANAQLGDTVANPSRNILNELRQSDPLRRLLDQPEFLNLYYYHLVDLSNTVFSAAVLNPLLDNLLGSWVPAEYIQAMKDFARDRVTYVRSVVPPVTAPTVATISGEPAELTPFDSATLTVGGASVASYQYRLNGGAWSPFVSVATPISLTGLSSGTYNVEVIGRSATGVTQSAYSPTKSQTWTVNTAIAGLRISEVLADNRSTAHEGTLPDMIELYNGGAATVDLSGKSISDRFDEPTKYVFAPNTTIPAGGYLVLYADSATTSGIHLGFSLDRSGEGVYLFDAPPDAMTDGALLDKVEFGAQLPDLSIARDVQYRWRLSTPTFGSANNAPVTIGNTNNVRINEWLADGERLFEADLLELYNPNAVPVSIGGMYLTDNPNGYPDKFKIAPNTFIAGQGYAVFVADERGSAGADHVNFQLSADRESIALLDRILQRVDTVIFPPQKSDVSQGRETDGAALYSWFSPPTFGLSNSESGSLPDPLALLDHLRITELMFNPLGDGELEFIELQNTGTATLNLEGVRFRNGVDFTFPAMTLAPGAYTVVVANPTKFALRYPGVSVAGQYTGRLDNGGENIELALPLPFDGNIQDFSYDDDWYAKSDGHGPSIVVVSALATNGAWDESSGWRQSYSMGGSPGRADLLYADQNGDGAVGLGDLILLRNKLGSGDLSGDLNNDGVVNEGDVASFVSSYFTSTAAPPSPAAAVVARAARDQAFAADTASDDALAIRARRATTAIRGTTAIRAVRRATDARSAPNGESSASASLAIDRALAEDSLLGTSESTRRGARRLSRTR